MPVHLFTLTAASLARAGFTLGRFGLNAARFGLRAATEIGRQSGRGISATARGVRRHGPRAARSARQGYIAVRENVRGTTETLDEVGGAVGEAISLGGARGEATRFRQEDRQRFRNALLGGRPTSGGILTDPEDLDRVNRLFKRRLRDAKPELERELRTATFRAAWRINQVSQHGLADHDTIRAIVDSELAKAGQTIEDRYG